MQLDKISEDYGKFHDKPLYKHFFEYSMFKLLGDVTGKSVLDLGCGEGYHPRMFKAMGATLVVGVDISTKMIEVAKDHEQKEPLGIEYFASDMADLRQGSNFDVVCMMLSLHYANDEDHLQQMCHVAYGHLVPGGRLVAIFCPQLESDDDLEFQKLGIFLRRLDLEERVVTAELKLYLTEDHKQEPLISHHRLFLLDTYKFCLKSAGFREIKCWPCSISPLAGTDRNYWDDVTKSKAFQSMTCVKKPQLPRMLM